MMSVVPAPVVAARRRLRIEGVVQGVGFRPFVYRLATKLGLAGHVGNDADGVFVEIEGPTGALDEFERRVESDAPPLARVAAVCSSPLAPEGASGFSVVESRAGDRPRTFVAPDTAVCDDCLAELFDPSNRRFRYPMINCTNCGPRFTITIRLPYDRPNTTMAGFAMCGECEREYHDPSDRRFHAQPVACPSCGPRVWFEGTGLHDTTAGVAQGPHASEEDGVGAPSGPISMAQRSFAAGGIVAVKGIGGYHLACDATNQAAVAELRRRKQREHKPFAVMVRDPDTARRLADLDSYEEAALSSAERPIVLVHRRDPSPLTPLVAPGNPRLGIFLPYTPLHHLLFAPVPGVDTPVPEALVMTSGNLSEEPICFEDGDARRRLGHMADGWLVHDRPIHVPCDDSVVRVHGESEVPVRRSRGYAPLPVSLPFESPPALAVGGELKNAFCVSKGRHAWLSQHIGDMGSVETLRAFERSVAQFTGMYEIEPRLLAADLHPSYTTRVWADRHGGELELVQHHHAHIAAVMAEHQLPVDAAVLGFAFDGTGFGTDGAIWGGEALSTTYNRAERVAHLRYTPLPGGDSAVRKPYRMALAHLRSAGIPWDADLPPVNAAAPSELQALERQMERNVGCIPTSSIGRLFDAVSSLLGICHVATYEAQAAIELEAAAEAPCEDPGYSFGRHAAGHEIDPAPLFEAMVEDLRRGRAAPDIARGFHHAVARMIGQTAESFRQDLKTDEVVLAGGVFQNTLLLRFATAELHKRGMNVLTSRVVPPNDAGLALGQLAVAAARRLKEPLR